MFPASRSARRMYSQIALTIALAGGAAVATAFAAPVAHAQDAQDAQELPEPSAGFVEFYNQIAPLVSGDTPDFAAAQPMIPTMLAAVANNRDRDIAGNVVITIGAGLNDRQIQRRGILLRLESGLVSPDQVGLFNWYAGNFALEVDDYAQAREHFKTAMAAGYSNPQTDLTNLIARTYLEEDDDAGSYNYLKQAIAQADAAGNVTPEAWIRNSLQYAYQNRLADEATDLVLRLVSNYSDDDAWSDGLRIMSQTLDLSEDATIDLFRLMAERGALIDRRDFRDYIEAIDPRLAANEVQDVLRMGVAADAWRDDDLYYTEVSAIAAQRAESDLSSGDEFVADARSGDALDAMSSGNALFSIDDYARAEEMYALALERGFNANAANIRMGVAQAMQGKTEAAIASFANVTGERAAVAALWTAHLESHVDNHVESMGSAPAAAQAEI